ncbi:hypothetical protein P7C70_g2480, partial [Phenoliferia sp. Uapishka_3]
MGKKAFSNPKYRLSGSIFQGFGVRGKVKPGGRISRDTAFPEGPGNVLNDDKAFSTYRRHAASNGSKAARAIAADKRDSYARTRPTSSHSDEGIQEEGEDNDNEDEEEEEEPDSDDLDEETPAQRRKRLRLSQASAQVSPPVLARSDSAQKVAEAAVVRANQEKAQRSQVIVLEDTDEDQPLDPLDAAMKRQLDRATYDQYLASKAQSKAGSSSGNAVAGPSSPRGSAAPSSSPKRAARFSAPTPFSPDKKPLFRIPSPTPSVELESEVADKSRPKRVAKPKPKLDPRIAIVSIGKSKFLQKTYDPAPPLDPRIEALVQRRKRRNEEEDSSEDTEEDEDVEDEEDDAKIQRRVKREMKRMADFEEKATKRKKDHREARGAGYSNPRRW